MYVVEKAGGGLKRPLPPKKKRWSGELIAASTFFYLKFRIAI
jgi:hypothetical protein